MKHPGFCIDQVTLEIQLHHHLRMIRSRQFTQAMNTVLILISTSSLFMMRLEMDSVATTAKGVTTSFWMDKW